MTPSEMQNGQIVVCPRCDRPCRARDDGSPDARLLRRTTSPTGVCVNCAVTSFLQQETIWGELLRDGSVTNLSILLDPRMQKQFEELMHVGKADATFPEINWQSVLDNWHLPFPKKKK